MPETNEVAVLPLEEKIEQEFKLEIVKVLPNAEAVVDTLKEKYMSIKVTDKASFKKAEEARKDVKNVRIAGEKIVSSFTKPLEEKKKAWIKKGKEWSEAVGEIEDYLEKQTDDWKQAEQKRKEEEARREQERLIKRQQELSNLGVLYFDGYFQLRDLRVEIREVEELEDAEYQERIFSPFLDLYNTIEVERHQEEQEQQEAEEKRKQEEGELRQQQEAFKKEQEELKQQRYELRMDRLRALGLEGQSTFDVMEMTNAQFHSYYQQMEIRIEEKRKIEEQRKEQERIAEVVKQRFGQLKMAIWDKDMSVATATWCSTDEPLYITIEDLRSLSDEDFNAFATYFNNSYDQWEAESERQRKEEEERQRKLDQQRIAGKARYEILCDLGFPDANTAVNLGTMPDDQWNTMHEAYRTQYDKKKQDEWVAEMQRKKDENKLKEKERLADMSDGERWREWKKQLQKFASEMPEFSSKRYTTMAEVAREKFGEVLALKAEKFSGK